MGARIDDDRSRPWSCHARRPAEGPTLAQCHAPRHRGAAHRPDPQAGAVRDRPSRPRLRADPAHDRRRGPREGHDHPRHPGGRQEHRGPRRPRGRPGHPGRGGPPGTGDGADRGRACRLRGRRRGHRGRPPHRPRPRPAGRHGHQRDRRSVPGMGHLRGGAAAGRRGHRLHGRRQLRPARLCHGGPQGPHRGRRLDASTRSGRPDDAGRGRGHAAFGWPTFASLNAIMLDGTGMCGGCRVQGGEDRLRLVDGPEFDAHQVDSASWPTAWARTACSRRRPRGGPSPGRRQEPPGRPRRRSTPRPGAA